MSLTAREREIMDLRERRGMTAGQIAARTGHPVSSVAKTIGMYDGSGDEARNNRMVRLGSQALLAALIREHGPEEQAALKHPGHAPGDRANQYV